MGEMQPGTVAAPLALARSYLRSIASLVTRLRTREKNRGAKERIYDKTLELIKDIEEKLNDVAPSTVLSENWEARLHRLNRSLQRTRGAFGTAQTSKDLEKLLAALHDEVVQLQQARPSPENPERRLPAAETVVTEVSTHETVPGNMVSTEMPARDIDEDQVSGDWLERFRERKPGLHLVTESGPLSAHVAPNVILVHGLNGDAVESWAGRSRNPPFWPRDFLGRDVPACRVWIYSYESQLESKQNLGFLANIASNLRRCVEQQTRGPLVWVAHSLGGIIVKQVLIMSHEQPSHDDREDVLRRTRGNGIIFIGTPHTGTSLASLTTRASNILSLFAEDTKAPHIVQEVGSALLIVPSKFAALLDVEDFMIISMFETNNSVTKDGPRLIVESSNRIRHAQEIVVHLDGTHKSMCKFESRVEEGYTQIVFYLELIVDSTRTQRRDFARPPTERRTTTTFSDAETVDISTVKQKIQMLLDNPITRWSPLKTKDPSNGTWFPKYSPEYERWLRDDERSPLLILGPFGSGKSMVMESILDDLRRRSGKEDSSNSCYLHLFFRSNQTAQQTSVTILQAFVSQALDQNDNLTRQLTKTLRAFETDRRAGARESWLTSTLRSLLENSAWRRVYLVVDALDECDDSRVDSVCEIFSWMLKVPKLRAIFSSIDDQNVKFAPDREKKKSLLSKMLIEFRDSDWNLSPVMFSRAYPPWESALREHIDKRLGLRGDPDDGQNEDSTSLPQHHRHFLRKTLINFPPISFSVVELLLQHFAANQAIRHALEADPSSSADGLIAAPHESELQSILQDLLRRQAKQGIYFLSLLACAHEPLGLLDIAAFKAFESSTGTCEPSKLILIARGIMSEISTPSMANLILVDARGLRLSSNVVRKGIKLQMKASNTSTIRDDSTNTFIQYHHMHLHLFRACNGLLGLSESRRGNPKVQSQWPNGRELPGVKYAQRNWSRHLKNGVKYQAADHPDIPSLLWSRLQKMLTDSGSDLTADRRGDRRHLLWLMLLEIFAASNLLGHAQTMHITSEHIRVMRILVKGNLSDGIRLGPDRLKLLQSFTDSVRSLAQNSSILPGAETQSSTSNVLRRWPEFPGKVLTSHSSIDLSDKVQIMARPRPDASLNLDQFLSDAHLSLERSEASDLDATLVEVGSGFDLDFDEAWQDSDRATSAMKEDNLSFELEAIKKTTHSTVKSLVPAADYALSWLEVAVRGRNEKAIGEILQHCRREVVRLPQNRLLEFPINAQKQQLVHLMLDSQQPFDLQSGLIAAAGSAGLGICEDLLRHGARVDSQNKRATGPLHLAAERGHDEIVKLLLKWNAPVNGLDEHGRSPLHLASRNGHTAIVEALLINGASLFRRTNDERSPFFLACEYGHRSTAARLFSFGASLDERSKGGLSVLHAAAKGGHLEIADMLLKAGLSADTQDDLKITPLHVAAECGWEAIVRILLDAGAGISTPCLGGATPLHFACTCAESPEAVIEMLLQREVDLEARDDLGRTPTHLAAHFATVRALCLLVAEERSVLETRDLSLRGVLDYTRHPTAGGKGKLTSSSARRREDESAALTSRQDQKLRFLSLHDLDASSFSPSSHSLIDLGWEVMTIRDLSRRILESSRSPEGPKHPVVAEEIPRPQPAKTKGSTGEQKASKVPTSGRRARGRARLSALMKVAMKALTV